MATTFQVLPIDVRKRIPRKGILEIVRRIAAEFHPQKIILFGSYAYGTPASRLGVFTPAALIASL